MTSPMLELRYGAAGEGPCLAAVRFGDAASEVAASEVAGVPDVVMPVLPDGGAAWETWTAGTMRDGGDGLRLAGDDLAFGVLSAAEDEDPDLATERLHARMLALLAGCGRPHPLRLWNYVPHITAAREGEERYRRFNRGRRRAMLDLPGPPPAASALGSLGGRQHLLFLAGRRPGLAIENPRQVSAYDYPPEYGPSPLFSRALLHEAGLFLSGTASILGHQSLHPGDVAAQAGETVRNLRALLGEAERLGFHGGRLRAKAYLRRAGDLAVVGELLRAAFPEGEFVYLRADVCRKELLVEVEGVVFPE